MEDAVRNLDGALDRRQQIEALLVAARAAVEEHKAAFKNVKGAPTIARKAKSQRLAAAVVHLERGFLPGEVAEIPQAPPGPLMASPEPSDDHPSPHVRSAGDERCCPPTIRRRGCVGHRATTFRAPLARAAHACMLIVVRRSRCVDRVRVDLSITAAGAAHSVCSLAAGFVYPGTSGRWLIGPAPRGVPRAPPERLGGCAAGARTHSKPLIPPHPAPCGLTLSGSRLRAPAHWHV